MLDKRVRFLISLIVLAAVCSVNAAAEIIYDNGPPAYNVSGSPMISDRDFYHEVADDFVLQPGKNVITDVHWWGVYSLVGYDPNGDDLLIRIFADVAGTPDTKPLYAVVVTDAHRTDTGIDLTGIFAGVDMYKYWAEFNPITLTAGTTYWLSITNDTTSDTSVDWWWMGHSLTGGNTVHRSADGGSWLAFGYEAAFQLTNDSAPIPEPATMLLLGSGLLGLWGARKKLKK